MSVLGKRRRLEAPSVSRGAGFRRPIDKELKAILQTTTTSVTSSVLKTTTFPCTVVGLRWNLTAHGEVASDNTLFWAIIVVKDGDSANTPAVSDGADFYQPEQNVLAFGVMGIVTTAVAGNLQVHESGSTKTMRKLKQGDVLQFITLNTDANGASIAGVIQFFCKS